MLPKTFMAWSPSFRKVSSAVFFHRQCRRRLFFSNRRSSAPPPLSFGPMAPPPLGAAIVARFFGPFPPPPLQFFRFFFFDCLVILPNGAIFCVARCSLLKIRLRFRGLWLFLQPLLVTFSHRTLVYFLLAIEPFFCSSFFLDLPLAVVGPSADREYGLWCP